MYSAKSEPSCHWVCWLTLVVGFVVMGLVVAIFMRVPKPVSGFSGGLTVASDISWAQAGNSGADARFLSSQSGLGQPQGALTTSGMIVGGHANGFLGAPEPPVFYDVGDVSSVYDTIVGAASDDSEGPITDTRRFAAESARKSGFSPSYNTALDKALLGR